MTVPIVVNPPWTQFGKGHAIVSGQSSDYVVRGYTSPLSFKAVRQGFARYRVNGVPRPVDAASGLIVARGDEYDLEIAGRDGTRTLCVFFDDAFAHALTNRHEFSSTPWVPIDYVVDRSARARRALKVLGDYAGNVLAGRPDEPARAEDALFELTAAMLEMTAESTRERDDLPARKPATRAELQRRLHRARDYMRSDFGAPLCVADVAHEAGLAPHYFHTLHRAVFGTTPMAALRDIRMARADDLLRSTRRPIIDICADVGLTSLGSFYRTYRQTFGITPGQVRKST